MVGAGGVQHVVCAAPAIDWVGARSLHRHALADGFEKMELIKAEGLARTKGKTREMAGPACCWIDRIAAAVYIVEDPCPVPCTRVVCRSCLRRTRIGGNDTDTDEFRIPGWLNLTLEQIRRRFSLQS
jgi:hypothetical protein